MARLGEGQGSPWPRVVWVQDKGARHFMTKTQERRAEAPRYSKNPRIRT